jgi:hypothetical protein
MIAVLQINRNTFTLEKKPSKLVISLVNRVSIIKNNNLKHYTG